MAVTTTPRLGLTRWSADADPFEREAIDANMGALEAGAAMYREGTLAARPAPGKPGRLYRVTDPANAQAATVFWDTGSAWVDVRGDLSGLATASHTHAGLVTTVAALASGITLTGTKVVDGYQTVAGDLVLAINEQGVAQYSAVYVVAAGAWTQVPGTRFDNGGIGRLYMVRNGTTYRGALVAATAYDTVPGGGQDLLFVRYNTTSLTV